MRTGKFRLLAVALSTFSVVAVSACSEVADPVSDTEQLQLPAPGTYVARDRGGNVVATGELQHSPETERVVWAVARSLLAIPTRSPIMGYISNYSDPDPECSGNVGDSEEGRQEFQDCANGLYRDPACAVVVLEYFRELGDLHAHCEAFH